MHDSALQFDTRSMGNSLLTCEELVASLAETLMREKSCDTLAPAISARVNLTLPGNLRPFRKLHSTRTSGIAL